MNNEIIQKYNIVTNNTADDLITFGLNLAIYDRYMREEDFIEADEIMLELKITLANYPEFNQLMQDQINDCLTKEDIKAGLS